MSLFVRNIFFTILQPGMVAGVIPYWMLKMRKAWSWPVFPGWPYAGLVLFIPGIMVLLLCITDFARHGKGTLSPADPTRQLVEKGLYRYSRNPMYVGVVLILAGEAIFFHAAVLASYTVFIFLLFHGFILWFEEPRLRRDFGDAYVAYQTRVNRWI